MPRPDPASPEGGGAADASPRIAALIPALNEEEALPGVLSGLGPSGIDRVVVVDNGSTDRTSQVAREGGAEVVWEPERGYGAACLAGIRHLAADPPDILVFLDGDQSDDPGALERILVPIRDGRADFVIGVRSSSAGEPRAVPLHAAMGNRLILAGMRLLHGVRAEDLGPFRAIRFPTLQALGMDDRNWGWTLQMQLRAHRLGVPTEEVEVPHRPRAAGRSKVSGTLSGSVMAGGKMIFTLFRERTRALDRVHPRVPGESEAPEPPIREGPPPEGDARRPEG